MYRYGTLCNFQYKKSYDVFVVLGDDLLRRPLVLHAVNHRVQGIGRTSQPSRKGKIQSLVIAEGDQG
jgi:hypothetical protein